MKPILRSVFSFSMLVMCAGTAIAENALKPNYPDCETLKNSALTKETNIDILKPFKQSSTAFMLATCSAFNEDDVRAISDRAYLTGGMPNGNRAELVKFLQLHFSAAPFPDISGLIIDWQSIEYAQPLNSQLYSLKAIEGKRRDEFAFMTQRGTSKVSFTVDDKMQQTCTALSGQNCDTFFAEVERITSIQNAFFSASDIDKAIVNTLIKRDEWDRFSNQARFMTFIDIALTSWVYSDEFSDGKSLPSPPEYQYFALRPSIVYEHFSAAPSGDKGELTLAVEWLGINDWDANIPWGISLASVYADRNMGRKLGHGLMLHIDNSFSLGFANRGGGDNSVYVNIDLLQWYGNFDAYGRFRQALSE